MARSTLAMSLNRHPTDDELAERLGVSTEELRNIMVGAAGYQSASLNAPVPHVDTELEAFVGEQDAALDGVADRVALDRLLLRLPDRERQLLNLRFYGNKTQVEIAETLGISQMHVSRLLSRTLSWLREALLTDAPSLWPGIGQAQDPTQLRTRVTTGPVGPVLSVRRRDRPGLRRGAAEGDRAGGLHPLAGDGDRPRARAVGGRGRRPRARRGGLGRGPRRRQSGHRSPTAGRPAGARRGRRDR